MFLTGRAEGQSGGRLGPSGSPREGAPRKLGRGGEKEPRPGQPSEPATTSCRPRPCWPKAFKSPPRLPFFCARVSVGTYPRRACDLHLPASAFPRDSHSKPRRATAAVLQSGKQGGNVGGPRSPNHDEGQIAGGSQIYGGRRDYPHFPETHAKAPKVLTRVSRPCEGREAASCGPAAQVLSAGAGPARTVGQRRDARSRALPGTGRQGEDALPGLRASGRLAEPGTARFSPSRCLCPPPGPRAPDPPRAASLQHHSLGQERQEKEA